MNTQNWLPDPTVGGAAVSYHFGFSNGGFVHRCEDGVRQLAGRKNVTAALRGP
ncbi:MAG: hypothetical protein P4N24_07345 [Acidobacteriota bacterium]|nr:hypothetical protein [Acidobacteriota bacterium]